MDEVSYTCLRVCAVLREVTICSLLVAGNNTRLLPTNKNPLWQIMAPVLRFMGASGINFVRESMPRLAATDLYLWQDVSLILFCFVFAGEHLPRTWTLF